MKFNRKQFLKLSALTTAAGMGGGAAISLLSRTGLSAAPHGESTEPTTKKRYAMVVDVSKCKADEGCTDCFDSCHSFHNVPTVGNRKEEVKWIWQEHYENLFPDQVDPYMDQEMLEEKKFITLCNHCDNPPCVRVCPTQATFKNDSNGIVMMDFHRCIGCRFCMAGCPYGSRSFNFRDPRKYMTDGPTNPDFPTRTKGVVEKCNFCAELVTKGEKPKCVSACKEGALIFGDMNDPNSEVRKIVKKNHTMRRKPELGTSPHVFYKGFEELS